MFALIFSLVFPVTWQIISLSAIIYGYRLSIDCYLHIAQPEHNFSEEEGEEREESKIEQVQAFYLRSRAKYDKAISGWILWTQTLQSREVLKN